MTWEFGEERNFSALLEYDRALEDLFRRTAALRGVCQYCEDTLPVQVVRDGLTSHQMVFINETLSRINPLYSHPAHAAPDPVGSSAAEASDTSERAAHA